MFEVGDRAGYSDVTAATHHPNSILCAYRILLTHMR